MSPPPPPWTCRLRAVVAPALVRTPGLRAGGFAVVDYADTPVGPYREALVAVALGLRSGWVPWMVVDSAASREGGREHWGLPKELAIVDTAWSGAGGLAGGVPGGPAGDPAGDLACDLVGGRVLAEGVDVHVRSRAAGGTGLPVSLRAVLRQPRRTPAPVRFTGRVRPAVVVVEGSLPQRVRPGRRPGLALDGELWIGEQRAGEQPVSDAPR